ncbi:MAG: type II secretion system protein [Patescibacteria group bacterium]
MIRMRKEQPGFTLIEMIVSISMITIISVLFIVDYRSANKRTDLIMTAQNMVADFHLAQNNTLGLVKYNGLVPASGWGIHLDTASDTYTLFADLNATGTPGYMEYDEGEGEIQYGARTTKLPAGVEINELRTGEYTTNNSINVTFLPPDPETMIYNGTETANYLEIKLKESRSDTYKTIRVNFLGLIEVLD